MFWTYTTTKNSKIAHQTARTARGFYNFHELYRTLASKITNLTTLLYGVRYGAKLALPVQKWHQKGLSTPEPPIFSPPSVLLPCADATQCFTKRPWGCVGAASARGGPSRGLHGSSKSDAVLDSWLIICVLFIHNCCKKESCVLGRNWSQTAK